MEEQHFLRDIKVCYLFLLYLNFKILDINEVFDSFGELKDKEWEKERYKIMNFCYLLTPK